MPDPAPAARFMLGTALYEAGASAAGEAQFRSVLARQPHSGRARVALGEALLAQRRYGEAAAEAAALGSDDPLAVIACRTELFARIAGGDGAGARSRAGARPRGRDGRAGARAVHAPGSSSRAAGTPTIALAAEAVPLLAVMLEALLRVQDFEAFEALLGLLAAHAAGRARAARAARRDVPAARLRRLGGGRVDGGLPQEPDAQRCVGLARVAAATRHAA